MNEIPINLDAGVLGDRLRLARVRARLTQENAARSTKLARTTLLAIEKGERKVRPVELLEFSRLYGASINELLQDEAVQINIEARFRALPETEHTRAESAIALINELASAEIRLEALLGRKSIRVYPPEKLISFGDVEQQAEDAAIEFRQRIGRGLAPLKDLVAILESDVGIRMFIRGIEERGISGLFIYEENVGACILINAFHSAARRLQSAAHEVGHFVATRSKPDIDSSAIDTNSREERFAKRFGFALLMPAPAIRTMFETSVREHGRFSPRHLVLMAAHFGVANEACCRRLEDINLLPKGTWESLRARGFTGEFSRRLLSEADYEEDAGERSSLTPRLWLLASEAYKRELVTEGQLVRMLKLSFVEVRRIIDTLDADGIDDLINVEH
jgi:Zn-dependent peptidase ImmA (M78 family)/DNA-binding XRE family transcriptional regulator